MVYVERVGAVEWRVTVDGVNLDSPDGTDVKDLLRAVAEDGGDAARRLAPVRALGGA